MRAAERYYELLGDAGRCWEIGEMLADQGDAMRCWEMPGDQRDARAAVARSLQQLTFHQRTDLEKLKKSYKN